MIGGITYMGWFHTIVGIPAIFTVLFAYVLHKKSIFGIFSVYQIIKISKGEMNEI